MLEAARNLKTRTSQQAGLSPLDFTAHVLGAAPVPYQQEILEALPRERKVAVRGPHGLGKTTIAAWCVLWGIGTFGDDFKIVTTASAWRQLVHFTWPEIHKWFRRAQWGIVDTAPELLTLSIKTAGGEAFAAASDRPDAIEGAHAKKLMYVFDEAKAIPNDIWDAAEGAFSTGDCYALAISTPGDRAGRFYDIHRRARGYEDWWVRHVTLQEAIDAGRISPVWAEQRLKQWGSDSPVYQARVLGEFPEQSDDALISLSDIEAARERVLTPRGDEESGVDVARFGDDDSSMFTRQGSCVIRAESWHGNDTMATAGRVKSNGARAYIDVIGVGSGVYDRLVEQGFECYPVNVAESAVDREHFVNRRSELAWNLRLRFQAGDIDLTRLSREMYDRLSGELTALKYKYNSKGQIQLEPKEDMKKRLGHSPDCADGLMLSWASDGQGTAQIETVRNTEYSISAW